MSEALTDEDRQRLEFQARMHKLSTPREHSWRKAKTAAKAASEWVAGIGLILGVLWMLDEIYIHVQLRVDHSWWEYLVWKFYWTWWPETVSLTAATVLALGMDEKNGPTRAQRLFTWNSAVLVFWIFLFGMLWTVEKLGPWFGIPAFLVVFVSAAVGWLRLDARFGYLNGPGTKSIP